MFGDIDVGPSEGGDGDEPEKEKPKNKLFKTILIIGTISVTVILIVLYVRFGDSTSSDVLTSNQSVQALQDEIDQEFYKYFTKKSILLIIMDTRISFSEPGNYLQYGIIVFHDFLFFFITLIFFFVISIFIMVMQVHIIEQESGYLRHLQGNPLKRLILSKVGHFPFLEFVWTIIPSIILANLAIPSFILLYLQDTVAHPIYTIKAIGNQWFWTYETNDFPWEPKEFAFDSYMIHESELEPGELRLLEVDNYLVVPAKMEIRLLVTSRDVLHSFALPSVNVKIDAIPGRLNQYPLIFDLPGNYYGQCSELCGPNHGFMPINVYVQTY